MRIDQVNWSRNLNNRRKVKAPWSLCACLHSIRLITSPVVPLLRWYHTIQNCLTNIYLLQTFLRRISVYLFYNILRYENITYHKLLKTSKNPLIRQFEVKHKRQINSDYLWSHVMISRKLLYRIWIGDTRTSAVYFSLVDENLVSQCKDNPHIGTQWCCEAPTVPNSIGVRPQTHPTT